MSCNETGVWRILFNAFLNWPSFCFCVQIRANVNRVALGNVNVRKPVEQVASHAADDSKLKTWQGSWVDYGVRWSHPVVTCLSFWTPCWCSPSLPRSVTWCWWRLPLSQNRRRLTGPPCGRPCISSLSTSCWQILPGMHRCLSKLTQVFAECFLEGIRWVKGGGNWLVLIVKCLFDLCLSFCTVHEFKKCQ